MRAALHLFLALALIVSSVGFGTARGQARIAGEMVLCAGGAVVVVAVDHGGNPVEKALICPDMALSLMAAIWGDAPVLPPPPREAPAARHDAGPQRGPDLPPALARGPPSIRA
ncbi:MAG: hypothetical protein Q4F71_02075 [Paracoccus sp. (in: a-proteobacteria)]|nr:hypothetical protein [Paracoccus sp. (in: a-proteobacteria)]